MKRLNVKVFRKILKEHNMTITRFAEEIEISRNTINNWIYRNVKIPDWKTEIVTEFFEEEFDETYSDLFI